MNRNPSERDGADAFLKSASHDLRAPLRHIVNFTNFVRDSADDRLTADEKEDLQRVSDAAGQMECLLDQLANYVKLDGIQPQKESVALAELVELVQRSLPPHQSDCIRVQNSVEMFADRLLMHEVLTCLIDNGLKYIGERSPDVVVEGQSNADHTVVTVTSRSIDVAHEHWQRILQPGTRGVTQSEYSGAGFGLAIAQKIVRAHQGELTFQSIPDRGAVVSITLPTAD